MGMGRMGTWAEHFAFDSMLSPFHLLTKLLKEFSKPFVEHTTLLLVSAEVFQAKQDRKQLQMQKFCLGQIIFFSCL